MHNLILSWVRTGVAAVMGSIVAWLALKGFDVDPAVATQVSLAVGAACVTLYQAIVSTLQQRWPVVGVLLGSTKAPAYSKAPEKYHPGEHAGRDVSGL